MQIRDFFHNIANIRLYYDSLKSEEYINKMQNGYAFNSNTINELLSDTFDYKGSAKNVLYVKDSSTGKPVMVKVIINDEKLENGDIVETYKLRNFKTKELVGQKIFVISRKNDNMVQISDDTMENCSKKLVGIGFRLDQIQIERLLKLGAKNILRCSLPQALTYHMKMGFKPIEDLKEVKSHRQAVKESNKTLKKFRGSDVKNVKYFSPIIVKKDGKFYLDENLTKANAFLRYCSEYLKKNKSKKLLFKIYGYINLMMDSKGLSEWQNKLKGHELLPRLKVKFKKV